MKINIFDTIIKWCRNINRDILVHGLEVMLVADLFWIEYILKQDKINSMHLFAWLVISPCIVISYFLLRKILHKIRTEKEDLLRHCLLNLRKIFTENAQKIYELIDSVKVRRAVEEGGKDPELQIRCRIRRYIINTKQQIINMIYNQLLAKGPIIGKAFHVALFEKDIDNVMRIKFFANAEQSRPKIASLQRGFNKKEGLTGWAWHYKRPIVIPSVTEYLEYLATPEYLAYKATHNIQDEPLFKKFEDFDYTDFHIESIVCFPVIVRRERSENVMAIVSIDCNNKNEFDQDDEIEYKQLKREIYPYIRLLSWLYALTNFYKDAVGTDIDQCACPLCMVGD
jgi:hypothetical protein